MECYDMLGGAVSSVCKEELNLMLVEASQGAVGLRM